MLFSEFTITHQFFSVFFLFFSFLSFFNVHDRTNCDWGGCGWIIKANVSGDIHLVLVCNEWVSISLCSYGFFLYFILSFTFGPLSTPFLFLKDTICKIVVFQNVPFYDQATDFSHSLTIYINVYFTICLLFWIYPQGIFFYVCVKAKDQWQWNRDK